MQIRMPAEQRTKVLQYFVQQKDIQHVISDLLPSSFGESAVHSGYWMSEDDNALENNDIVECNNENNNSYGHKSLQTSEARVAANMSIVHFEALLTLHFIVMHLTRAERSLMHQQVPAHTRRQSRASNDAPTTKQKSNLADKLLLKYRFIIDSVVDVRLTRTAEAPVALAKFLVVHFGGVVQPSRRRNSLVPINPVGAKDFRYRGCRKERRRNSIAAIAAGESNQESHKDDSERESGNLEAQADALRHLRAFLTDYERNLHPVTHRSRLFRAQNTILAPLSTFSQQTASDDMNAILLSYRLECQNRNRTHRRRPSSPTDDPLTIEQLIGDEIEEDNAASQHQRRRSRRRMSAGESSLKNSFDNIDRHELCGSRIHSTVGKSSSLSLHCHHVEMASHIPRNIASKRRRHSLASSTHSNIKISDLSSPLPFPHTNKGSSSSDSQQEHGEMILTESVVAHQGSADPTPPPASRRAMAHACDACIGCNDVCANNKCFFCAEKEYQLRLAFGGSAVARGDQLKQMRHRPERLPPVSMTMEQRHYSSCELRRHKTQRSCWVLVDGDIYDVTDLLGVHPGGAQVLLEAAQSGKDCASVFATHPPAARQVLANYRLGKFYHCETRTLHQ